MICSNFYLGKEVNKDRINKDTSLTDFCGHNLTFILPGNFLVLKEAFVIIDLETPCLCDNRGAKVKVDEERCTRF